MSAKVSKEWGYRAHEVTNRYRSSKGLTTLDWSDDLHEIAFQRCKEVATRVTPFGQTNFLNLISQARTIFQPDYNVVSFTEEMAKITMAVNIDEDYIGLW